jgi:hypothetical protein
MLKYPTRKKQLFPDVTVNRNQQSNAISHVSTVFVFPVTTMFTSNGKHVKGQRSCLFCSLHQLAVYRTERSYDDSTEILNKLHAAFAQNNLTYSMHIILQHLVLMLQEYIL